MPTLIPERVRWTKLAVSPSGSRDPLNRAGRSQPPGPGDETGPTEECVTAGGQHRVGRHPVQPVHLGQPLDLLHHREHHSDLGRGERQNVGQPDHEQGQHQAELHGQDDVGRRLHRPSRSVLHPPPTAPGDPEREREEEPGGRGDGQDVAGDQLLAGEHDEEESGQIRKVAYGRTFRSSAPHHDDQQGAAAEEEQDHQGDQPGRKGAEQEEQQRRGHADEAQREGGRGDVPAVPEPADRGFDEDLAPDLPHDRDGCYDDQAEQHSADSAEDRPDDGQEGGDRPVDLIPGTEPPGRPQADSEGEVLGQEVQQLVVEGRRGWIGRGRVR